MGSSKRTNGSTVTLNSNKKQKKQQQEPIQLMEEELSSSDNQQDEDIAFDDDEELDTLTNDLAGSEEEEDSNDSEINEFEQEEEEGDFEDLEEDDEDEDDDLIGDDGEDLMANVGEQDDEEDDEESEDEDEDEENNKNIPIPTSAPIKRANVRNSKGVVPLKPEELRALAFAELTASPISSILSTQVSTFLKPLSPLTPTTSPLQPLLKSLHSHITSLPSQPITTLREMKKKGIVVPKLEGDESKFSKVEMKWEKPKAEEVRIVGSWAWGGSLKVNGEYFVDMAIAIPETLLQPKDYLYPRFLYKSTQYLITLASLLPSSLGPVSLSYASLPLDQGYCLEIRSAHKKDSTIPKVGLSISKGAVIRLSIVSPLEFFPNSKLTPLSNISRPSILPSTPSTSITPFHPTPLQSSSILFSSLSLQTNHLKYFHSISLSNPSFTASVKLLQIWAQNHFFNSTLGLSQDFWAWCVARSLNWGSIDNKSNASSSSNGREVNGGEAWAGWRKAVEWLAGANWKDGIYFRVEGNQAFDKDDFRTGFAGKPIFVDPTGTVNLAAGIDLATLEMLKLDAKTTIALLLSGIDDEDKFEGAFMKEIRVSERYDNYARITIPTKLISSIDSDLTVDFPSKLYYLTSSISSTLQRALGSRARAFQINTPTPASISISNPSTSKVSSITLTLGILVDGAEAGRLVDQGPSAEDEVACEEFRSFWGERSELRRFKDGSILESVVWEEITDPALGQQRNKVVSKVVEYILGSRHSIPSENISIFAGSLDHFLVEPFNVRRAIYLEDSVASNKGFGNIMTAFDVISKELRDLPDLPLPITAVQPSSSGLRYSTIFTPSPRRLKAFEKFPDSTKFIEVHDIVLTLEGSGRWPEDLEGVQKIKSAFLAKIAQGLSKLHSIVKAELVFDLDSKPIDDNVSLEILTSSGYAFRARIFYERSLLLLKSRAAKLPPSPTSTIPTPLELYNERFVHSPRHHAALATLQHHFTSYSHTVRLVKRWFSSHMLTSHISNEHLELLSASVFIDPASIYEPPNSGATGFARVMSKLSNWNWKDEPLVVCLYTFSVATTSGRRPKFPESDRILLKSKFERTRLEDLNSNQFSWRICTEEDLDGKVWGRKTDKVIAGRVRTLARATLKVLNDGLVEGSLIVEQLFNPPLEAYSFLIHLNASKVSRHFQSLSPQSAASSTSTSTPHSSSMILSGSLMGESNLNQEEPLLGWDPVEDFVKQLESHYSSVCLIFYSPDGAPIIAGVWNPISETSRPWKVGLGFPCKPIIEANGKNKVIIDKDEILRDIERLGKGLVVRVEKRN